MTLQLISLLNFLIYKENLIFFFISVVRRPDTAGYKIVPGHWFQKTGCLAVERPLPSLWQPLRWRRLDTGGWGRQSRGQASARQTLP
jgi:hypothetical protein